MNYRSLYNRWIHQRCCQSKEIWHNFWWQHQHNVPISKAGWTNVAKLTCLPKKNKKLSLCHFSTWKTKFYSSLCSNALHCNLDFWSPRKLSLNWIMPLNGMILCSKLKIGLWKIVTKSQVVTKFNVTKSRLHCTA